MNYSLEQKSAQSTGSYPGNYQTHPNQNYDLLTHWHPRTLAGATQPKRWEYKSIRLIRDGKEVK